MQTISNNVPVGINPLKEKDSPEAIVSHQPLTLKRLSNDVVQTSFGHSSQKLDYLQKVTEASQNGSLKFINLRKMYKNKIFSENELKFIIQSNAGKINPKDLEFFIKKRIPLTKYDTPEILEQRLYNLKVKRLEPTSKSFLEQKERILKNEYDKMDQVICGKKITIITGFPGAGKSTILKNLHLDAYNADTDIIKEQFKEYNGGKGAQVVHEASRLLLVDNILPNAFKQGKNITLQTLGWPHYVERLSEQAKSLGYKVELIHVDVTIPTAIKRNIKRFEETNRLVDPYYTFETDYSSPIRNHDLPDYFNGSKFIDKVTVYDNNGEKPALVKKQSIFYKILNPIRRFITKLKQFLNIQ